MAINRQKISQMTPKGSDLEATDLLEVSVQTGSGYETRSITGQEIIDAAAGGTGTVTSVGLTTGTTGTDINVTNSPITTSGDITLNIPTASATNTGKLSSTDWSTFNNKGNGTVTSIGTAGLISGGTITTSGTVTTSMNTNKLVGRATAGVGIMEEITVGTGLTLTGAGVLNNTATPTATGYYGAWQDLTTQTAAVNNVGYPIKFGTIDYENQVRIVTDGTNLTRITFDNTGIYNLNFSVQIQNVDNAEHDVTIWLRKNGTDVTGSAGYITVPKRRSTGAGLEGHNVIGWNYLLSVVAGDYYQLMWSTTSAANVTLHFYAAGSPPPSTASTLAIVTQQAGIMGGTGVTAINGLTNAVQTFATGTSGTDFAISSTGTAHTFNIPTASASNRGALSTTDWSTFNGKQAALVSGTNIKTVNSNSLLGSGNISVGTLTSVTGTAPIASSGGTTPVISISQSTTSTDGYLSSTDWTTFNNKASYTPRVQSVTSASTVTPVSTNDLVKITAQAAALALANPTGTWDEGQPLMIRIKDNGTARAITWDTNYRAIGITLPTTTVLSKTTYVGIIYNSTDGKWDAIGVTTQT